MVIGGFQGRFNWISIHTCDMNEGSSVNTDLFFYYSERGFSVRF